MKSYPAQQMMPDSTERPTHSSELKRLERWHNKVITADQYKTFIDMIITIPVTALTDIVTRHIADTPPTPGRFPTPNQIRQGWWIWQKENPSKVARSQKTKCPECGGRGFLWCRRPAIVSGKAVTITGGAPYIEEVVYRCAKCENWKDDSGTYMPAATIQELIKEGYTVLGADSGSYSKIARAVQAENMKDAINSVAERF